MKPALIPIDGLREVARGGAGVNRSLIKLFCKNRPISQVQTPRPKHCKKIMSTQNNSVEITPSML
jgi:hypothetical protein